MTNINSAESSLPINSLVSPATHGIVTDFLKVAQIKGNSFEEVSCQRPYDYCYFVDGRVKFNHTPWNLHLEFSYSIEECVGYEVFFNIDKIFVVLNEQGVSLLKFDKLSPVLIGEEVMKKQ